MKLKVKSITRFDEIEDAYWKGFDNGVIDERNRIKNEMNISAILFNDPDLERKIM